MNARTMQDKIDRDLLTIDQAIAKQSDIIDRATSARVSLEHARRALLAAASALRGETP